MKPWWESDAIEDADPTGLHPVSEELMQQAKGQNYQIVYVICAHYEPESVNGSCVSFMALTPRPGDQIQLEDGQFCSVTRVYFKVGRLGDNFALVPNVYATLITNDED